MLYRQVIGFPDSPGRLPYPSTISRAGPARNPDKRESPAAASAGAPRTARTGEATPPAESEQPPDQRQCREEQDDRQRPVAAAESEQEHAAQDEAEPEQPHQRREGVAHPARPLAPLATPSAAVVLTRPGGHRPLPTRSLPGLPLPPGAPVRQAGGRPRGLR